jgi:hypothetical protein
MFSETKSFAAVASVMHPTGDDIFFGSSLEAVVMIDDRVAGILLGEVEGTTAVVRSRVWCPAITAVG